MEGTPSIHLSKLYSSQQIITYAHTHVTCKAVAASLKWANTGLAPFVPSSETIELHAVEEPIALKGVV